MPFIHEQERQGPEPVAIVGMACRLPGSIDSASKFWQTLRDKRSVRTAQVPSSRFNIDAHYHPDLSRPGSYSALGGYFLEGDPVDFDPSFFNMTPVEAQWLDPQQRKMLEVCYEVLENAGVRLDQAAGSNTGVYAASFTSDYQQMSIFERDFRHNYAATGVDPGIISNRINNAFNLMGPSCMINTACSSALYAIHNACHALRTRDCDATIAAGVNLIMMVDQQMNTAKLGVLSPTSECHTFDESADGYGRAEAVGALYLKRLSDAIRDGDIIRGVIRTSAVNTNGKVEGMGITFPNALGQERVLRQAYKRASLDPNKTAYLECHGTGTPTGDPIEVKAVARGMNDTRSREKPLILGAAKASIGHSEAASGIFATMKAALMTEKAEIPGVYGFKKLNPAIRDKEWNVQIATDLMPWPAGFDVRRASVSSFGYGGTNAHLVVESIESLCSWYEHGEQKSTAKYTYDAATIDRPFLVTMSAHDQKTLGRNIEAHRDVADNYYLPDLAHTLNVRKTRFPGARGYTITWPGQEKEAFESSSFSFMKEGSKQFSSTGQQPVEIGFVLTGQGSQWARMGCEAMRRFPSFRESMEAMDRVLQRVITVSDHKPSWSLRQVLEAPAESSLVGQPDKSQTTCTAIQIAVIDLFVSWGITPTVTVGHSSGEIAAAYAAGRISAPEAILAAYLRGLAVTRAAPMGTMLAVGVGSTKVREYIDLLPADVAGRVTVACENSPASCTLSGSHDDIAATKQILDDLGIFARQLRTGRAYHSPHMDAVAPLYEELYAQAHTNLTEADRSWRQPQAGMVSSVTGAKLALEDYPELSIAYWCSNLRGRVRFDSAVQALARDPDFANVKVLVEIGPHGALRGPVGQILAEYGLDNLAYAGSSLHRGQDDAVSLLKAAGDLYLQGVQLEFDMVNGLNMNPVTTHTDIVSVPVKGSGQSPQWRCLVDLPPYQWNYERKHWYEPRAIADLRTSKHPRHDVLGRRIFGMSTSCQTWKNVLRQRDVAWFPHHTLGTDVVFPAAGHVSLAIEALLQQLDLEPAEAGGVRFADIDIRKALMVPDSDGGIEVHTRLEKNLTTSADWYTFTVESVTQDSGMWTLHSTGKIRRDKTAKQGLPASDCPYKPINLHQRVAPKRWYRALNRVGFRYGPSFQTMVEGVRANGKDRWASAGIRVHTRQTELESRYMLHPSTIDGCLHAVIAAVHRGLYKEMPWGVVPLTIEDMSVSFPPSDGRSDDGQCFAWVDDDASSNRHFFGNVQLFAGSGEVVMDIRNLKMVAYEAAIPPSMLTESTAAREPYRRVNWHEWAGDNQSVSKDEDDVRVDGQVVVLVSPIQDTNGPDLAVALGQDTTARVFITELTPERLEQFRGIVIDDSVGSILASATEQSWTCLQRILLNSGSDKPIVWVTRGANQGESVNSGLPQGFLRAVRFEAPTASISLIDADKEVAAEQVAGLVQSQLLSKQAQPGQQQKDVEFWLTKDSRVLVPRLEPNHALNQCFFGKQEQDDDEQNYTSDVLSADKSYKSVLVDDKLVWEEATTPKDLDPFEVEIQVILSEFTKSDISTRRDGGARARIITGTITRTGSGLDKELSGRAAVTYYKSTGSNGDFLVSRISTSVFAVLPANLGMYYPAAAATSLLLHFVNVVDALLSADVNLDTSSKNIKEQHVIAVVERSDTAFVKALTKLGTHVGLKVSTITTDDGGENLRRLTQLDHDNCQAALVVSGAPNAELVRCVWKAAPPRSTVVFGRDASVEAYSPLDTRPFTRGVALRATSSSCSDRDTKRTLEISVQLLDSIVREPDSDLLSSTNAVVVDVQELSVSLNSVRKTITTKTDGKNYMNENVLKIDYGESNVAFRQPRPQRHPPAQFDPDAAYLLVGCLGGLGRSLTTWMQQRGCRHFIFISRSGAAKSEATDVVNRLKASGAGVQVFSADAGDAKAVVDVVQYVSSTMPIRGVVHAAMVLRDGLYENMTFAAYQAALRPKMQAAIALDQALTLADQRVDFFLMTSSISAVLGNPGQANYCAANSFLDFFALHLRRKGVPACSVALPAVEDVGVVAENSAVAEALARKMPFGINEKEMLLAFEAAIFHASSGQGGTSTEQDGHEVDLDLGDAQLILGLEPEAMLRAMQDDEVDLLDAFWHRDARMSLVRESLEAKQKEQGGASGGENGSERSFVATLGAQKLPGDEMLKAVGTHIVERAARILGSEVDTFQLEGKSVGNHGVDSMIGVELQRWLFSEFGLQVSVSALSDPKTTFGGLAGHVARHLGLLGGEESV